MSSLIIATTSLSVSKISVSRGVDSSSAETASTPSAKKSMRCEKTWGLIVLQAPSSFFETVTKSCWIKTPVMWSTVNNFLARGDLLASASPFVKWNPELVSAPNLTGCEGRNFNEKGFGVFSTWMKTERAQRGAARRRRVVAARIVIFLRRCNCSAVGAARVPEPNC